MANEPFLIRKMRFATLILATSFIIGSIAGPLTPTSNQCSLTCIDNNKFSYEIGKTYVYKYVAETTTKLQRDGKQEANLRIRAKVEFEPIAKCDYILRLRDVYLEDPSSDVPVVGANEFQIALESYPLQFGNLDGKVKNVCPHNNEAVWVTNIKRGILSTFQNAMDNLETEQSLQEIDITGNCLTHYTIDEGTWLSNTVIKKSKVLLGCDGRTDHYTSFQSNPYHPNIASKTTPLVKSSHNCEQIIKHGQLQQSICVESHTFQPFSESKGTGAVSTNTQRLEFVNEEQGKFTNNEMISKRTTLLFDHKYREFGQNPNEKEAEEALKDLCRVAVDDIRPETPRLFSKLVHKLQELNYEKLMVIYKNADEICYGNPKARKFLHDAVPLTGSDAGVTLMRDLILNHEVSKADADTWLLMLSFLPKPSKEIIAKSMPLLDHPSELPKGLLAVSALTHSYCKINPDCGKEIEVKNLVNKLVINLGKDCRSTSDQEKEIIILALKALGNIGHIEDALPILETCYQTTENPIEIRLAALDAFRRLPCSFNRDQIADTFFKFDEDAEVRIGAYLAIMKCPSKSILTKVRENLDNEEINQVGSFVWTHLTSLQETSDPYKLELKKILVSKKLQKKFSTDVRKFSRYFEGSLFLDSIKTGALADGTLIFSPKSYLPRSSTLGLTVDVFGENINLFEVGGRVEGFEFLVESFFGPKGYFPDDTIQKILESAREKKSYDETKLNEIAKIFNVKHYTEEEPRGEMFLRVFGNEINFMQFKGLEQLLQRSTDKFNLLHELIQLTQKEDSEYTKSFMFMDSSLIIPTSVGFPLNLTVNGTATVNLKIGGKLDLSQLRSKSLNLKMKIQPSASVEIAGSMIMDAFVTRTGLKMVATMHTSTYANGQVVLKNGEVLKAHIDMPKDQMEIFDIQSKIYILDGIEEKVHAPLLADQTNMKKCTGEGLSKVLGLQLCGEIEFPSGGSDSDVPSFPLAGPVAARIYLQKTDKALKSYNLEYQWDRQLMTPEASKPYYVRTGLLSLDTPGSTVNRELKGEMVFNEDDKTFDLQLVSPFKKLFFNGQFINDKTQKKMDVSFKVDDKERLALQSELQMDYGRNSYRVTPSVSLVIEGRPIVSFKGYALQQDGKKYSTEMTMEHVMNQPITVSGFLTKGDRSEKLRYDADFTINSGPIFSYAKWFMNMGSSDMASKGTIEYRWFKGEKTSVTFSTKTSTTEEPTSGMNKLNVEAEFQTTASPHYNWALYWNMLRGDGRMENTFAVYYGKEKSNNLNTLSIRHVYQREGSLLEHQVTSSAQILFPPANLDASFELTHELTKSSLNTNLILKPKANKKISFVVGVNRGTEQQELIRGLARLNWYDSQIELTGNVLQPRMGEFIITAGSKWAEDAEATAVLTLKKHGPAHESWGRILIAKFTLPGQEPIILSGDVLLNGAEKSAHGEMQLNGEQYRTYAEYYRPSLENVKIVTGAKSSKREYSATADFVNSDNEKSASTNFRLGSGRRVLADIGLKQDGIHTNGKAFMALDADNYPENKYTIQMDLKKQNIGSDGSIVVKCPMHDVDMGISWNVSSGGSAILDPYILTGHYELWMVEKRITADVDLKATLHSTARNIDAKLQINTPFEGIRRIGLTAAHHDSEAKWKNSALLQVDNQMLSTWHSLGSFFTTNGAKKLEMEVKMETPFFVAPVLLNVSHSWSKHEANTDLALDLDAKNPIKITIAFVDGSSPGTFHKMIKANLTTPNTWVGKIDFATNLMHKDKTMIQTELVWDEDRYFVDYEGSSRMIGHKVDSYSTIQLNTPFNAFEVVTSSIRFSMDASSVTTAFDFAWDKDKRIALEMTGANQNGNSDSNALASLHFVSPFQPLDDVLLTMSHSLKQKIAGYNVGVKWAPDQAVAMRLEYLVESAKKVYIKLDVEEPFGAFTRFGSNVRYTIDEERFSSNIVGTLNEAMVDASVHFQKAINENNGITLTGVTTLKTSFEELRNAVFKFEHKSNPSSYDTRTNIEYNEQEISLKHVFRFRDATDFHNSLQIILPEEIFQVREINLKNMQSLSEATFKHESEISWAPDQKYSAGAKWTTKMRPLHFHFDGDLQLSTPLKNYGPFSLLASRDIVNKAVESRLTINYWPGKNIDFSTSFEATSLTGKGLAKLTTPFYQFESLAISGEYDLGIDEKSANVIVQWAPQKQIEASVMHRMDALTWNSEVTVSTPFAGYEFSNASFAFNGNQATKMGQLEFTFAGQTVTISAQGKMGMSKGDLTLSITSPFQGFENLVMSSDFDVSYLDKTATFRSSYNKIQIIVSHNVSSNTMDSGITFVSSIPDFERLTIGAHFDDIDKEKKCAISIEKGASKVNFIANIAAGPLKGHMDLAFSSPIKELESLKFASKYGFSPEEKDFHIMFAHNSKAIELATNQKIFDENKSQYFATLTTPCPHFEKMTISGAYDIGDSVMVGEVSISRNEHKANLKCELEFSVEKTNMKITMTTPIEGLESIQLRSSLAVEDQVYSAAVLLQKAQSVFEANFQTLISPLKGFTKIWMKSPIEGYKHISTSVEYNKSQNRREVKILAQKEEAKYAIQGVFTRDANITNANLDINTPILGYESLIFTAKSDMSRPKSFHQVTFQKGSEKYIGTMEMMYVNSYFEFNLHTKTPTEVASFYANYNFANPNSLGYDVKIMKGKIMMDMKGRFRKQPNKENVEAYFSLNTNYQQLTSFEIGGMYDFSETSVKEFKFHCNLNGQINNVVGAFTKAEDGNSLVMSAKGSSAYLELDSFNFTGVTHLSIPEPELVMTFEKNGRSIVAKGKLEVNNSNPQKSVTFLVEDNGLNVFQITARRYSDNQKTEHSVDVQSHFGKSKSFFASQKTGLSSQGKTIETNLKFIADSQNVLVNFVGSVRVGGKIDIQAKVNGDFVIPFINDRTASAKLVFDYMENSVAAAVATGERDIFTMTLDKQGEKFVMDFFTPLTKNVVIRCQYVPGGLRKFLFEIERESETLMKLDAQIRPEESHFEFATRLISIEPMAFRAEYNEDGGKKIISARYSQGADTIELGAYLLSKVENVAFYETKFVLKSTFEKWEDIQFEVRFDYAHHKFDVISSLQWAADRRMHLSFGGSPYSGIRFIFTSPFVSYERVSFMAERLFEEYRITVHLTGEWSAMKMGMMLIYEPGEVSLTVNSPFRGFQELSALWKYNKEPLETNLILQLSPDKKIELVAFADLQAQKSKWNFYLRTPFNDHDSYALEGEYDFVSNHTIRVLVEGKGQKYETSVKYGKVAGKLQSIHLNINTPMKTLRNFDLDASYNLHGNKSQAVIAVNANGQLFEASGNALRKEDGFNFDFETSSPVPQFERFLISGRSKMTGENQIADLFFKLNDTSILSFMGTVERNPTHGFKAHLKMMTPLGPLNNCGIQTSFVRGKDETKLESSLYWNKEGKSIKMETRLTESEFGLQLTTPFSVLRKIRFDGKLIPTQKHFFLLSTVEVDDYKGRVYLEWKNLLPSHYEVTFDMSTPFPNFDKLFTSLNFNAHPTSRLVDGKFLLLTPFEAFRKMEALLKFENNNFMKTDLLVSLNLPSLDYSIEGTMENDGSGNSETKLIINTPHRNLETVTFKSNFLYVDNAERGATISLTTPHSQHNIRGSYVLKIGNIGFELGADSMLLAPYSPLAIQSKYNHDGSNARLAMAIVCAETTHVISWTQAADLTAYNGKIEFEKSLGNLDSKDSWYVEYFVDLPVPSSDAGMTVTTNAIYQRGTVKTQMASVALAIKEEGRYFDAIFLFKPNGVRHMLSAKYRIMDQAYMEGTFEMQSPVLPSNEFILTAKMNNKDAAVKAFVGKVENSFTVSYKTRSSDYEAVLKINAPTLDITDFTITNKLTLRSNLLKGEVVLRTSKTIHSFTTLYSSSPKEALFRLNLRTPFGGLDSFMVDGRLTTEAEQQLSAILSITFRRLIHKMTMNLNYDQSNVNGNLLLESPFLKSKSFSVQMQLARAGSKGGSGLLKIMSGEVFHKGQFNVACDDKETTAEILLETPLWDLNSLAVKSRYLREGYQRLDANLLVTTPQNTHSFGCKFDQDQMQKQVHLSAHTPYLKSGPFSMTMKTTNNLASLAIEFTIHTQRNNHTGIFEVLKANRGRSLRMTLETPFLDINTLSLQASLIELSSNKLETSLEFNFRDISHLVNVKAEYGNDKIDYDINVQTPIFNIGYISCNGQFSLVDRNRINIDTTISSKSGKSFSMHGFLQRRSHELLNGQLEINAPGMDPIEIAADVSKFSIRGITASITAKTPLGPHGIWVQFRRESNNFEFQVKLDSNLLPCQTLLLTGNFTIYLPMHIEGGFALQTPGKVFQFSSNYRNTDSNNLEGGFTIVTPFQGLPLLRVNGNLARNQKADGFDGGLEMHTTESGQPEAALYLKFNKGTDKRALIIFSLQIPMLGYRDVSFNYGSEILEDSSRFITLKFKCNNYIYGYEATILRKPGLRDIQVKAYAGQMLFAMKTTLERKANEYKIDFVLETPIKPFENIEYNMRHIGESTGHYILQHRISGTEFKYGFNGEFDFVDKRNFDGNVAIETSLKGYEKIGFKWQKIFKDEFVQYVFEQTLAEVPTVHLLVENRQHGFDGNGKIELSTPFEMLKTADAFYKYDHSNEDVNANIGMDHNGRKLFRINAISKPGTKIVEIINPIQPITIQYTYAIRNNAIVVQGEYCWDSSRRSKATIGFDAKITKTDSGRQIVLHTIHPTRPLKMKFSVETTRGVIVQSGEISWDESEESSIGYVIKTQKMTNGKIMIHNANTQILLPFNVLEFDSHWEKDVTTAKYVMAFLWDAARDRSKMMEISFEHQSMNERMEPGLWTTASFRYPKRNQNITLHGEFINNPDRTNSLLELIYGQTPEEKFVLKSTLSDLSTTSTGNGYSLAVSMKHPPSNIDVNVVSNLINSSQEMGAGMKFAYMDRFGQFKNLELRSKILKLNNHIGVMMKSHANKLLLSARLRDQQNGYMMHLESQLNDMEPITADLLLQQKDLPMATFNAVYDPRTKRSLNVRAGMQDMKTIVMDAHRTDENLVIEEMSLLMNLNRSKEFITRFNWRPSVLKEIEEGFGAKIHSICGNVRDFMNEFMSEAAFEINHKSIALKQSLTDAVLPIVMAVTDEMTSFDKSTVIMRRGILHMYNNNEFYYRDIYDSITSYNICKRLCSTVMTTVKSVTNSLRSVLASISATINDMREMCNHMCSRMTAIVRGHIQDIPYAILHYVNALNNFGVRTINEVALKGLKFVKDLFFYWVPPLSEWQISSPEWVHRISYDVTRQLQDYVDKFFQSSYFQKLVDNFGRIESSLLCLYNNEYVQRLIQLAQPIWNYFDQSVQNLLEHPYVKLLSRAADYSAEMATWAYDFFKIQDRAKDLVGLLMARGEDMILYLVQEMILPNYQFPNLKHDIIFEPDNGKLQILQTLPVMWSSFTELPNIYDSVEYSDLVNLKDSLIRLPRASINKLFQAMRSEFTWKHMVPTFRGRALLVGNQHYMTFDGRAYEFAGECSYLLAHDFMDKNFTAIVKYTPNASEKKHFVIILDGNNIELYPNLTVSVNGERMELPLNLAQTRISRSHGSLTVVNEAKQIWTHYQTTHDLFMLEIGGFYHGKTAGLFGTYDHEPFDDFSTPERKTVTDLDEFTSSWEVGSKTCTSKKNLAHRAAINSYAIQKPCNDIFGEYESLTPCLRKINPSPYKGMCVNDVSIGQSPCIAVAAYAMMCSANGIAVTLPDTCLECKIGNEVVPQGKEVTLEGPNVPRTLDVAFVIDNTWQCSTTYPNLRTSLATIARNLEGAMSTVELDNIRYSVVGFGVGAPYTPQVITANGEIFGSVATFDLALNNTHFSAGHYHQIAELIEFAADLPYRAGAGKVMIVVPCAEPTELYKNYNRLASKLKEIDIKLHVTSIHEPILNGMNKIKASDIFGFDQDLAYTLTSSQRGILVGDKDLRRQMSIPKNTLTQLALDTDGSIFFTSKLASSQPSICKLTTEVFSRRVAKNAAPSGCQNCLCTTGTDGTPRTVCSKCYTEEIS